MRQHNFLLVRVFRYQDADAYAELYDNYYNRIRRHIAFKIGRKEDVEELASEVFLRGWEYATSSQVENANAFFYRIASNLVADFYRSREKKRSYPIEIVEDLLEDSQSIIEDIDNKQEVKRLLTKILQLKDEYRDILVMRFLDELSIKEIAEALEKTPNATRVTLHRAKNALSRLI
jgi:RNA polymerase sigma-70 factor (ECF subfamily)